MHHGSTRDKNVIPVTWADTATAHLRLPRLADTVTIGFLRTRTCRLAGSACAYQLRRMASRISPIWDLESPNLSDDAGSPPWRATPRSLTSPQFRRAVSFNVRRHVLRATTRVAVLIAGDLGAIEMAKIAVSGLRSSGVLARGTWQSLAAWFPLGFLHFGQFAVALVLGLALTGNYGAGERRRNSARRIMLGVCIATAMQLWQSLWTVGIVLTAVRYAGTVALIGILIVVFHRVFDAALRAAYRHERMPAIRALLVGRKADCERMAATAALDGRHGMTVINAIHTEGFTVDSGTRVHPIHELEYLIHASRADTVVICGYPGPAVVSRAVKAALASECHVLSWNPNYDILGTQPGMSWWGGQPFIEWHAPALRWWQRMAKRVMDIVLSGVALAVLLPLMGLIAIAVKLSSPGPIVFGHMRLGRFGQAFRCYKFRSMYADAEQRLRSDPALYAEYVRNDFKLPADRDARITPLGRFLRRTSLDELPQLWNVLRGDMSLVGPRPIVADELQFYEADGPLLFLSLRPGITGAWQVKGRSHIAYPERARMEVEYVQGWSFANDVGLLLRTLPAVVAQRGAH